MFEKDLMKNEKIVQLLAQGRGHILSWTHGAENEQGTFNELLYKSIIKQSLPRTLRGTSS